MKKLVHFLSILIIIVLLSSCNLFNNNTLSGKWEHTNSTASESFVLELSSTTWTYYKNSAVLEKGILETDGNQLIMGHEAEEGTDHDHAAHAYTWNLNDVKDTLTLVHDDTKSVFVRKE